MDTIDQIRRKRLVMLAEKYGGVASLSHRLGYARTETTRLSRILNANLRHERGGKPYLMGSAMAREIEEKLGLEEGWMDNAPSPFNLRGDGRLHQAIVMMQALPPAQLDVVLGMLTGLAATIVQPTSQDGFAQRPEQARLAA